ncbi:hypothetical protein AWB81_04229 [Caballeronia arationis]|uniref:hypothetical protein n=1 Tax=Caballeronia arationis TaxID=1777142 RepID=UPI00074BC456|nr:hypothetical protein [Caballeronia arationis]SAK83674.1 hypothetical protein AWB81_04229 [Caballeronia arationis]
MRISASLSAVGNLLALIVASNPKFSVITEDALKVQSVAAIDAGADGVNSSVVVAAGGYADTQVFTYKRVALADAAGVSTFSLAPAADAQAADLVAGVAASYGLLASELSLIDGDAVVAGAASSVTVVAASSSVVYAPSTIVVALTWPAPAPAPAPEPAVDPAPVAPVTPSISSLVDNSALGGFEGADVAAQAAPAQADASTDAVPAADAPADAAPSSTEPNVAATN